MKKFAKLGAAALVSLCVCMLVCFAANAVTLSDIDGHWAKEYIEYGVEKGYISGYEDGTFLPDKTVTRAEFSKMINNAIKLTAVGTAKGDFSDVDTKEWYFNEVKKAENAGYITGYDDGTFRPSNSVTRQEAAVILSRIVLPVSQRVDVNTFGDGNSVDFWAEDAVSMIAAKGYIKGDENGDFLPKGALTRSQAAKLICEFVKNENIINKNQNVTEADGDIIYSETLFTDDIAIDVEDAQDLNIVLKNCRVLGNVYVKVAGADVKMENAAVKTLYVFENNIVVSADKSSEIKNATVKYPTSLVGNAFKKVVLEGKELSSGIVRLDGTFDNVVIADNALVSADKVANMSVAGRVATTVMSGTIETFTAENSAKGATITLASNVVIDRAVNNATVTYTGSGKIDLAENNVTGVVFDKVTVSRTIGKVGDNGEGTGATDDSFFGSVEVYPENGRANLPINTSTVFTFLKTVYDKDGSTLTSSYVESNFKVRKGSLDGPVVAFTGVIASSGNRIIIEPVVNYAISTTYYVIIPKGVLSYEDGTTNDEYVTTFKTASSSNAYDDNYNNDYNNNYNNGYNNNTNVTFEPANGTAAAIDSDISVSFLDRVYQTYNNGTLTPDYCKNYAFEIRKGSLNGASVGFSATVVPTYRKIILSPNELLQTNTTYFVVLKSNTLYDSTGAYIPYAYSSFTTEGGFKIDVTPENGRVGVSTMPEIVLSFNEDVVPVDGGELRGSYIEDKVVEIRNSYYGGTPVGFTATVMGSGRTVKIVPDYALTAGAMYYITINAKTLVGVSSGAENEYHTSYFTVASNTTPMVTPSSGSTGVSTGTDITIAFNDGLYTSYSYAADRRAVDVAYLKGADATKNDDDIITLRRGSATGKIIDCDISISGNIVTLKPKQPLEMDQKYCVSILGYKIYGNTTYYAYDQTTSFFDTTSEFTPKFYIGSMILTDGADRISVSPSIRVTFDTPLRTSTGSDNIYATYVVENAIKLYKGTGVTANKIDIKAEVSGDRKTITVSPRYELDSYTTYTLVVDSSQFMDDLGAFNNGGRVTFTTDVNLDQTVTYKPVNPYNVSIYEKPEIIFETPIRKAGGGYVDNQYATENVILAKSGYYYDQSNKVEATVKVSNDRVLTIEPNKPLDLGAAYYITVAADVFVYADEVTPVNQIYYSFTVTYDMPELLSVGCNSNNVTETGAVIDFTTDCEGTVYVEIDGQTLSKACTRNVQGSITVNNLVGGKGYTAVVYVISNGIESERKTVSFTTDAPVVCAKCGGNHTTASCTATQCEICLKYNCNETTGCKTCHTHEHLETDPHCTNCNGYGHDANSCTQPPANS